MLVRFVLATELRAAGMTVIETDTAEQALGYLRAGNPVDLVFSDVQMPGAIDGAALALRLREEYPVLGIILTSGRAMPAQVSGQFRFIPKPYRFEAVLAAIRETLGPPPALEGHD